MTYFEKIKQARDGTEAQKIIFGLIDIAMDVAYNMWINEKNQATAWYNWFKPAIIKVLDTEVEG